MPFFAKAAIDALKQHPSLNAAIDTEKGEVTYFDRENLAIAVDTEKGLLTPVIKEAGDLSIAGLARKIADVAERTRTNKITPDELSGGTFTLTNTGSRGALFDTPIINQPQVAILGTGAVVKRAVVIDDANLGETIAVRQMVYLALTYDHRLVDGADAARFLGRRQGAARERAVRGLTGRSGRPGRCLGQSRNDWGMQSCCAREPPRRADQPADHRPGLGRVAARDPTAPPRRQDGAMRIVIAGSTGLLGTRLTEELRRRGHTLTRLVRRPAQSADESCWDPHAGQIDDTVIHAADVVVNCAGSRLFGIPHSSGWQRSMVDSRVNTTRVLAESIARADRPPAFLACNGSSYYGDHGAEMVTEESDSRGDAFMTQVTSAWQEAADPAVAAGARVCILRIAPVMTRGGDTLGILEPLFRFGLGARLGDGTQYFPAVSLRDWIEAVTMLAEHPTASGPVNVCCPETPTNAEFTEPSRRPSTARRSSSCLAGC